MFSLGCVFFNCVTGKFLFNGNDTYSTLLMNKECNLNAIREYLYSSTSELELTQNCKDLLMKMLNSEPLFRPSAKECLEHPWFKEDRQIICDLLQLNRVISHNDIDPNEMLSVI